MVRYGLADNHKYSYMDPTLHFHFVVMVLVFKKDSMYMIAGMLLVVLISDQFTSSFMKPYFGRLRPCYDPQIASMVHVVKSCGGRFGFASGHSANSFGIAIFVWLVFRHYDKSFFAMFLWAFFVAFSRIMVGVHYPVISWQGLWLACCLVGWYLSLQKKCTFVSTCSHL
jgi:undecaprenyl-diphosphatase